MDFVLRLSLCMCKPSRMKVWTAVWGTGLVLKWSHQAGRSKEGLLLLRGAVLCPSSRIPSCSLVPAAVLEGLWGQTDPKCTPASTCHVCAAPLMVRCSKGWCWPRGRSSQKQKLEQKVTRRGDRGQPQSSSTLSSSSVFGSALCDCEW